MHRYMGLMNDYICEAGNDETLQEDLDYIASSEIPVEALRDSKVLVTGFWRSADLRPPLRGHAL